MSERFTDQARQAMALANQEAMRNKHQYIGTEDILAGLAGTVSGTASIVLRELGITLPDIRSELKKLLKAGPKAKAAGTIPQIPRAKKVIEIAINHCRSLEHHDVGTGHLLLGLLDDTDTAARQVLLNLRLQLEDVRTRILNALSHDPLH
jgi:ATP-dependent Clp protease ATP-binding subunit ClpC